MDPQHWKEGFRIRINLMRIPDPAFHFNADPDPAFYLNVDPDPDPVPHQRNANLRPLAYRPFKYPF
jgi:hypothetical protein